MAIQLSQVWSPWKLLVDAAKPGGSLWESMILMLYPPETNSKSSENQWLQDEISFWDPIIGGNTFDERNPANHLWDVVQNRS